jgi:biopolymer transport protein ExbD
MPGEDISALNLTAMMDMMTILLVFLVKSYTTDPERITLTDFLRPPQSTAKAEVKPAVTITVTSEEILVENKAVVRLEDLSPSEIGSALIPQLQDALTTRVDALKSQEQAGFRKFDGSLLVVAHRTTPYSILTTVLYTAGQAQFSDYRLMVQKKEQ